MGNRTSANPSNNNQTTSKSPSSSFKSSLSSPLKHAVVLQGLPGCGVSTIQSQLGLSDSRVLNVPLEFVTTPSVYTAVDRYEHPNQPYQHWGAMTPEQQRIEKLWSFGGRGSSIPRFTLAADLTQATIFVIDSTDRARLGAQDSQSDAPLTDEFISNYMKKSMVEQDEILATLASRLTAKSLFQQLMKQLSHSNTYKQKPTKPLLILATKQDLPNAMSVDEIADHLNLKSLEMQDWHVAGIDAVSGEGLQEAVDWLNNIIASPTDFSKQIEEINQSRNDRYLINQIRWNIANRKENAQKKLIEAGKVPKAPKLYLTNGKLFEVTEEARQGFILPPVTLHDDDLEDEPKQEDGAKVEAKVQADSNAEPTVELISKLLNSIHEEDKDVEAESAVHEANEREESVSVSSSSSSNAVDEISHHQSTVNDASSESPSTLVEEVLLAVDVLKKEGVLNDKQESSEQVSSMKKQYSMKPFSSLSSAPFVLPLHAAIPQGKLVLKKKHWYSRKEKWVEIDASQQSIHKQEWFNMGFY